MKIVGCLRECFCSRQIYLVPCVTIIRLLLFIGARKTRQTEGVFNQSRGTTVSGRINSRFVRDVTAAILLYRTIAKKAFADCNSIIMQYLSDILPFFCTQTRPSHYLSEKQEFNFENYSVCLATE